MSAKEILEKFRGKKNDESDDYSDSDLSDSEEDSEEDEEEEEEDSEEESSEDEEERIIHTNIDDLMEIDPSLIRPEDRPQFEADKPNSDVTQTTVDSSQQQKAFYINVKRTEQIQEVRQKLPVCGEEQTIMEKIRENPCIIVCGATGSGKTTQIPQFLFEAGYGHPEGENPGMVGITQPRRVAAVSTSVRVGEELGDMGKFVGYQIRYDTKVDKDTRIKFMTDGVLLREVSKDFLLQKYSVIILDEAHERTLNTDILIGVLSRSLKLRNKMAQEGKPGIKPLRLIIMSATLRVQDFVENQKLFEPTEIPPVINVEARQYPVVAHFSKRTELQDYVGEAFTKVGRIHQKLPKGGILVFLTGQNEIQQLVYKLKKVYGSKKSFARENFVENKDNQIGWEAEDYQNDAGNNKVVEEDAEEDVTYDSDLDEDEYEDEEDLMEELREEAKQNPTQTASKDQPLYVLPLYSLLPTQQQLKVFEPVPEGHRLCIVATNVAETSLTIPGIRYVVDCGRAKEKRYNIDTGITSYEVDWTSKASAEQRTGRAGRTGPGHCYRLYSSTVYNDYFTQFSDPEIFRTSIEGTILLMKAMNLDKVQNFPFPTPPPLSNIIRGENLLEYLGALKSRVKTITDIGKIMVQFPVNPRLGKMLSVGNQFGCLEYVIALVAAITCGDPFIKPDFVSNEDDEMDEDDDDRKQINSKAKRDYYRSLQLHGGKEPTSDLLRVLNVIGAFEYEPESNQATFCENHCLRLKTLQEIRQLRRQLTHIIQIYFPSANISLNPKMSPPNAEQRVAIRQILLAGYLDQVAIRAKYLDPDLNLKGMRGEPYKIMWDSEIPSSEGNGLDKYVYLEDSSCLHGKKILPDIVVYSQLDKTSSGRVLMKGNTEIDPSWLTSICSALTKLSKPIVLPTGQKSLQSLISKVKSNVSSSDPTRIVSVTPFYGPKGWKLPDLKVLQELKKGKWEDREIL